MKLHLPAFLRKSLLSCLSAVIVCTMGSGAAWAEPQNLTHHGSYLYWDTQSESFVNEEGNAAAFAEGDNVSFTGESDVALGQDITAGTVAIEQGADVTIDLDVYELNVDRIELSGLLDMGYSLHIGEGTTLSVQSASAVLDSNLVLGDKGGFEVGAAVSLNHNALTLQGNTSFTLTAAGDGKTYTLLSGVSALLDAQGNAISLDDTNNAISNYFDVSQPGTGFWADGTLQLTDAGTLQLVLHNETVKEAITITSRQTYPSAYQYYAGIAFEDISNDSDSYASGGAIEAAEGSTIELNNNGCVVFEGNTVSSISDRSDSYSYGGAINGGTITLNNNNSVVFDGNGTFSVSLDRYYATSCGGAIYGCTITLNNNGIVLFASNTASSSSPGPFSACSCGVAIYGDSYSIITLCENDSVSFTSNTASSFGVLFVSSRGGAIYGDDYSIIALSENASVIFTSNTASSSGDSIISSYGGAIYGGIDSSITLNDNGIVSFTANEVYTNGDDNYTYGGAIAVFGGSDSTITLSENDIVTFTSNTASSLGAEFGYTGGGAIYGGDDSTITLNNNGSVVFEGNAATTSSSRTARSYGGAIDGSAITLNNNGSVVFEGNSATTTSSYSYGGAIFGDTITISDNGSVVFEGNSATTTSYSYGGAIYARGDINIRNNGSVLFEKNAENSSGTYRLRSIYAGGTGKEISLSVAEDKNIEFRDSIYIASGNTVSLNADYVDETGVTHKQAGDIIFTGAYTEQHLNELLAAAEAGRTATSSEILNSRTSEVLAMTNLYGGRLRVEGEAIYKGQGITVHEGSAATVRVKDAELNHVGYDLTFNDGTALEVAGESTIRGQVNLQEGSVFKLELGAVLCLHETAGSDAATLTVNGSALLSGTSTLNAGLTLADGATLDMDYLDAGAVTLNGALTFGEQVTIGENLLALLEDIKTQTEGVALFTGIDSLTLPQTATTTTSGRVWAGVVFSNLASNQNYYLVYQADTGTLSIVYNVPEPATATLSLLALAALAARRRRKS